MEEAHSQAREPQPVCLGGVGVAKSPGCWIQGLWNFLRMNFSVRIYDMNSI